MRGSHKAILVLSDGLRYDTAVECMGYLGHLLETGAASLFKVVGETPSISRPMYETVQTGLPVSRHGIVSNLVVRRSNVPSVFSAAVQAGRTTAAAAYFWFSELYNRAPFDRIEDREVDDPSQLIQHGRFYAEDEFPDAEVFASAAMLVRRFSPDYLLVHPMGVDTAGEAHGSDSRAYREQALRQDIMLAGLLVEWTSLGYTILVSGDHGMNSDGQHGGTTSAERDVPLFVLMPGSAGKGNTGRTISQLQIAPTLCRLLAVDIPDTMTHPPLDL